jgi:hypothetical protein
MIRLSHAVRPPVMSNGEDHSADSERFLNEPLSAAPAAQLRRLKASSPPRAQILSQRLKSSGTSPNFLSALASPKSPVVWPPSNETFVPATELLISIYVRPGVSLSFRAGAGQVHKQSIFEPGEPQCANACGFSMAVSYARCSLANSVATLASRVGARWDTTL